MAAETGTLHAAVPRRSSLASSRVACLSLLWLWRGLPWLGLMTEIGTADASRRSDDKSAERIGNDLHRRIGQNGPRDRRGFLAATLIDRDTEEMSLAFQNGRYGYYRDQVCSKLAMTARALSQFQDSAELSRLYAPLKVR